MAEAVAAIGLAASIATFVDLGVKLVSRVKDFSAQTSETPQFFRALADRLPLLIRTLQQVRGRANAGNVSDDVASDLQLHVDSITIQVAYLEECLRKITPPANASRLERTIKALQSLTKDEQVAQAVKKVDIEINALMLYQTTTTVDLSDRILQTLTDLKQSRAGSTYAGGRGNVYGVQVSQIQHGVSFSAYAPSPQQHYSCTHHSAALKRPPELVSAGAGLIALATGLAESGRKIRRVCNSYGDAPIFMNDFASELETFAHAFYNLEKDRQSQRHIPVDDASLQRCMETSNRAGDRIRCALARLETIVNNCGVDRLPYSASDESEIHQICNELERAKTSLAFGYQLYMETYRKMDTSLILQLLADNSFAFPQQSLLSTIGHDPRRNETNNLVRWNTLSHRSDKGNDKRPSGSTFDVVESSLTTTQRWSTYNNSRKEWRLRFSPWFASRVWGLSFQIAQTGFKFQMSTANLVPENALIFEACRDGDMLEVQSLFRERKASPFDYCYRYESWDKGHTVLSAAAESGNIQLCRYLIEEAGFPITPKGLKDPLEAYIDYVGLELAENSDMIEMFRLLLKQPERDDHFDGLIRGERHHRWWFSCPGVSCMRLIKERSLITFGDLPWETQVGIAIDGTGFRIASLPTMFLETLGSSVVDTRIATARDGEGRTALHMLAGGILRYYEFHADPTSTWSTFIRDLIESGADLHRRTKDGLTPLMYCLQSYWLKWSDLNLQKWIRLLNMAGVDLETYGQVESALWKASYASDLEDDRIRIESFTFGPKVEDWTADIWREAQISIYQLDSPPGSWNRDDEHRIQTIFWRPQLEERDDLWPWKIGRAIYPYSLSRKVAVDGENDNVDAALNRDARKSDIMRTQDDCGALVRLLHRSFAPSTRPRSYSAPPTSKGRYDDPWEPWAPGWFPGLHLCRGDGKVRLGVPEVSLVGPSHWYSDRRCVKGIHDCNIQTIWNSQNGINKQLRRFRRRYRDLSELRALSYEAYAPEWKNKKKQSVV